LQSVADSTASRLRGRPQWAAMQIGRCGNFAAYAAARAKRKPAISSIYGAQLRSLPRSHDVPFVPFLFRSQFIEFLLPSSRGLCLKKLCLPLINLMVKLPQPTETFSIRVAVEGHKFTQSGQRVSDSLCCFSQSARINWPNSLTCSSGRFGTTIAQSQPFRD